MNKINIFYDEKGMPSESCFVVEAGKDVGITVNIPPIYTEIEIGIESNGTYTVQSLNRQQTTFSIILQPKEIISVGGSVSNEKHQLRLEPVYIRTFGSRVM